MIVELYCFRTVLSPELAKQLLQLQHDIAFANLATFGDIQAGNRARLVRLDWVFHFHGLENDDDITF